MNIPDLGAIKRANDLKAATPPWSAGEPVFTLPVGVPVSENGASFTAAIDRLATNLAVDGWKIIAVRQVSALGIEETEEGLVCGFQISAQVAQIEKDETVADS